jgi:uncharacterized protein (TIGR02452 family)
MILLYRFYTFIFGKFMTSASFPAPVQNCITPMTNWVQQHPQLATATAIAFAALGITASFTVATLATSVSLAMILGLATVLSLASSALLSYSIIHHTFFKNQGLTEDGSPPNIALSDVNGQKNYRVQVMNDTLRHLKTGFYTSPDGTRHTLDLTRAAQGANLVLSAGNVEQRPGNEPMRIIVKNQDCLYAAAELYAKGLNPLVLDMGCDEHFGGGYLEGDRAQEEECCRRSGLGMAGDTQHGVQHRNFYPLSVHSNSAGIYVPHVPIFRAGYDKGYQCLNHPFEVAFGVIAAFNRPHLENNSGRPRLRQVEAAATREKIRTFFEMARQQGHKSVVFGALGCGAFRNPPDHISEIVMDVIRNEFAHCFNEIVIAVLDDHNTGHAHNPEGNFKPFARCALAIGGRAFDANGQELTNV